MHEAVDVVRRVREAVGPDTDICIEMHNRMKPGDAVTLARALEPYFPMYMEDPIRPQSPDAMAWVADHSPVPIATGERFLNLHQPRRSRAARRRGHRYRAADTRPGRREDSQGLGALGESRQRCRRSAQ